MAGLDELNTSYDDFHSPFADIKCIINVVAAALDANLRVGLGVIVDKDATWNASTVRGALAAGLGLTTTELEPRVAIIDDFPTPTDSGAALDVGSLNPGSKVDMGCPEVLKTVSLHPNGLVKACCGHAMFYVPDLTLGNLYDEPLKEILGRSEKNFVYWWVHMFGPKRILEKLGIKGEYSSICHACHVLFSRYRDKLLDYVHDHQNEVFVTDVVFSDNTKRAARRALERKDEILSKMRSVGL